MNSAVRQKILDMEKEKEKHEKSENWWAATAIHEAEHGIVAMALGCYPVSLRLYRNKLGPTIRRFYVESKKKERMAGYCHAAFTNTPFGRYASIFVRNAPFPGNVYFPYGEPATDMDERFDTALIFRHATGVTTNALFKLYVDNPVLEFFGDDEVQKQVVAMSRDLFREGFLKVTGPTHYPLPAVRINALKKAVDTLVKNYPIRQWK